MFDQIFAALLSIRDFFADPKLLYSYSSVYYAVCIC